MATYLDIQNDVRARYGWVPQSCWIAHVRELNGLEPKRALNRKSPKVREKPCPAHKRDAIEDSMRLHGILK